MEPGELYRKLQQHLDRMPVGFPATESGVEIRILQRLFTPDEAALAGDISQDSASLAHADLLALPVELFPYEPVAIRVWDLRGNVTAYDAWYVALAEALGVPLDQGWINACCVSFGYPTGRWGVAARRPVHEVSYRNRWGEPVGFEVPKPLWP